MKTERTRKTESENFVQIAEKAVRQLEETEQKCIKAKSIAHEILSKEIQRTQYSFMVLEQVLEDEKSLCISELNQRFSFQTSTIDSFMAKINSNKKELGEFIVDTKNNMELIIKKMEMKQFEEIIAFYHKKIQETQEITKKSPIQMEVASCQLQMESGASEKVRQIIRGSLQTTLHSFDPFQEDMEEKAKEILLVSSILPELKQVEAIKNGGVTTPSVESQNGNSFREVVNLNEMNGQYEMVGGSLSNSQVNQKEPIFKREESKAIGPRNQMKGETKGSLKDSIQSSNSLKQRESSQLGDLGKSLSEEEEERKNQNDFFENFWSKNGQATKEQETSNENNPFECLRNIALESGLQLEDKEDGLSLLESKRSQNEAGEILHEVGLDGKPLLESLKEKESNKRNEGARQKPKRHNSVKQSEIDLVGGSMIKGDQIDHESLVSSGNRTLGNNSVKGRGKKTSTELSSDSELALSENGLMDKSQESAGRLTNKANGSQSQRGPSNSSLFNQFKQPNTSSTKHLTNLAHIVSTSRAPNNSSIYQNLIGHNAHHPHAHANTTAGEFFSHGASISSQSAGSSISSQNFKKKKEGKSTSGVISAFGRERIGSNQEKKRPSTMISSTPRSSQARLPVPSIGSGSPLNKSLLNKKKETNQSSRPLSMNDPGFQSK